MIDDLDRTVEELLKRELSPALVGQVAISFSAPDSGFPPSSVTLPALTYHFVTHRELKRWATIFGCIWNKQRLQFGAPLRKANSETVVKARHRKHGI